jgi:hypothetical protein
MWPTWRGAKYTLRGEGGGFPQVRAVVSLVCPCCLWLILAPKVLQICTNHLVWVVCRPMWVSEACQLFWVPSQGSNTPLYLSKCCELRSVPWFLPLPLFFTWIYVWVLWGVGSASFTHFPCLITLSCGLFQTLENNLKRIKTTLWLKRIVVNIIRVHSQAR